MSKVKPSANTESLDPPMALRAQESFQTFTRSSSPAALTPPAPPSSAWRPLCKTAPSRGRPPARRAVDLRLRRRRGGDRLFLNCACSSCLTRSSKFSFVLKGCHISLRRSFQHPKTRGRTSVMRPRPPARSKCFNGERQPPLKLSRLPSRKARSAGSVVW